MFRYCGGGFAGLIIYCGQRRSRLLASSKARRAIAKNCGIRGRGRAETLKPSAYLELHVHARKNITLWIIMFSIRHCAAQNLTPIAHNRKARREIKPGARGLLDKSCVSRNNSTHNPTSDRALGWEIITHILGATDSRLDDSVLWPPRVN